MRTNSAGDLSNDPQNQEMKKLPRWLKWSGIVLALVFFAALAIYMGYRLYVQYLLRPAPPLEGCKVSEQAWFDLDESRARYPGVFTSPDQAHYAFIKSFYNNPDHKSYDPADRQCLVLDGVPGPEYHKVGSPDFSRDGKHMAYTAERDGQSFFVLDGKEIPAKGQVTPASYKLWDYFSPDSAHWAFTSKETETITDPDTGEKKKSERYFANVDGTTFGPYPAMFPLISFSADGKHFAWLVNDNGSLSLYLDGSEKEVIGNFKAKSVVFLNRNGTKVAFVIGKDDDKKEWMWVNGKLQGPYEGIFRLFHTELENANWYIFSMDGSHCGYLAQNDGKCFSVIDGTRGKEFSTKGVAGDANTPPLTFGATGRTAFTVPTAYNPSSFDDSFVVVDGRKPRTNGWAWRTMNPYFSPDGKHVGYMRFRRFPVPCWTCVVDDVEEAAFAYLYSFDSWLQLPVNQYPVFSPDSRHHAYAVMRDPALSVVRRENPVKNCTYIDEIITGSWRLVVDGMEIPETAGPDAISIVWFDETGNPCYLRKHGNTVYKGKVTLPAGF